MKTDSPYTRVQLAMMAACYANAAVSLAQLDEETSKSLTGPNIEPRLFDHFRQVQADPLRFLFGRGKHDGKVLLPDGWPEGVSEDEWIPTDDLVNNLRTAHALLRTAIHLGEDVVGEGVDMETYQRFTEINEHEGETWTFWLQTSGNEVQLAKFAALIDKINEEDESGEDPQYSLGEVRDEEFVDVLLEESDEGYMAAHTRLVGTFTCPDDLGEFGDVIYKGQISKLWKIAPLDENHDDNPHSYHEAGDY